MGPLGPILVILHNSQSNGRNLESDRGRSINRWTEKFQRPSAGRQTSRVGRQIRKRRNLGYPPGGYGQESFGDFLKHFDSIVLVRRRRGRDLLAAPVEMPELLAEATESGAARLREDIFEAFTRIPRGVPPAEPWYVPSSDSVVWLLPTELSGSGELIKFHPRLWSRAKRAKVVHPIRRSGGRRCRKGSLLSDKRI